MKKNIIFGLIIVSFVLAGCKQEAKDAKEASTEVLKELSGGQEAVTETPGQNMHGSLTVEYQEKYLQVL